MYQQLCRACLLILIVSLAVFRPLQAEAQETSPSGSPEASTRTESTIEALGSYERSAMSLALSKRGLTIDVEPEGKILGRIYVVNLDVFGEAEGFLRLVNFLHVTTRPHVIEREVLLWPGQMWDQDVVDETQRKLKDPLFTSLVVLVPVRSKAPGEIDLLVVTRDVWSLRMNSTFEYLEGKLTDLRLSIAENNILGLRKHGAFAFDMNQSNFTLGPQYLDKALAGTRLQLTGRFSAIFSRESSEYEGTSSGVSLLYPLWSLSQKWGGGITFSHYDSIIREFRSTEVELYDNAATEEVEAVPRIYALRSLGLENRVVRSFGKSVKQEVSGGHSLTVRRPDFLGDFEGSDELRAALERDVLGRSERASALFLRYRLFTPRYIVYRNLNTYDLAEDVRLGPELTGGVSAALEPIGSEVTFYRGDLGAAYVLDLMSDGFARFSTGASTRIQDGELIDNLMSGTVHVAAPRIANSFRIVGRAYGGVRLRERGSDRFQLGGSNGLRGYQIAEFAGQKLVLTNLEVRSMPVRVLFARVGGVAFWDMGDTANRLGDLRMKHGVGFGIRSLSPQLQPIVFRLDWAIPLQGPSAGFPGRISAGVAQTF